MEGKTMHEFITVKTTEEMGRIGADIFALEIKKKPDLVLGLATGSSPISLYRELVRMHKEDRLDFSRVRTVNLDEYVGLPANHPQSYRAFMNEYLFDHVNIELANTHLPNGMAEDLSEEWKRYDGLVNSLGGIDVQLLGIGPNGHIGFNEPSDQFSKHTQVVPLTQETIDANARFFSDEAEVPREAITLDVRHIMQAKKIVLVATRNKESILRKALQGPITSQIPASVLQLHQDLTVIFSEGE